MLEVTQYGMGYEARVNSNNSISGLGSNKLVSVFGSSGLLNSILMVRTLCIKAS